jgi:hypothetical protein
MRTSSAPLRRRLGFSASLLIGQSVHGQASNDQFTLLRSQVQWVYMYIIYICNMYIYIHNYI